MTHKGERQDLDPASLGTQAADGVAELVRGVGLGDGAGLGEGALEVVEAVRDGSVLHDVALVQNVGPGRRDEDVDQVVVGDFEVGRVERDKGLASNRDRRIEAHLAEELHTFWPVKVEAGARVDVRRARGEGPRGEDRGEDGARSARGGSRVDDSDRLNPAQDRFELFER